nr:HNH endonuclease [Nocardia brasiliensis]
MTVSRRLRFEILRRDNHTCRYCGTSAPDAPMTVDHVIPVALGGSDEPSNLITACKDCNAGKSSIAPDGPQVAEVNERALRWTAALQQAAAEREIEYQNQKAIAADFRERWESQGWDHLSYASRPVPLPSGFANSVQRLLSAGLSFSDFDELIEVTMTTTTVAAENKWQYFCGCCWKRVKASQERAVALVDDGTIDPLSLCGEAFAHHAEQPAPVSRDAIATALQAVLFYDDSADAEDLRRSHPELVETAQNQNWDFAILVRAIYENCKPDGVPLFVADYLCEVTD